ncbi:uncharacterized protein LOC143515101 isoform X2 [Brachyhypopomus gauderio]|uniref:uncharacterized protein LOC143515101 isoform X2 n=1 Tax=Brachyhypopomus gauderio TaxID=698409 RepID=UPI0040436730
MAAPARQPRGEWARRAPARCSSCSPHALPASLAAGPHGHGNLKSRVLTPNVTVGVHSMPATDASPTRAQFTDGD